MTDPAPDPAALVLGCLAEIRGVDSDDWTEGTVDELGLRLHRVRVLQVVLHRIGQDISDTLVASMTEDAMAFPGGQLHREPAGTSAWVHDGASERMRDDLARAVANDVALDVATGEVDPMKRNIALRALRTAYEVIPSFSTLKVAGRRRLGLRIDDYRSFGTSYKITIEAPDDEEGG